jgi:mono/diheme cytochrome c family protein
MKHVINLTLAALVMAALPALAQESGERQEPRGPGAQDLGATTDAFLMEDGEAIYQSACAGCHQPQGQGAVGAGTYPPLAANQRLEGGGYPAWIIINGMGAMPSFGDWLTDDQIVAVITFLQQNFGNDYDHHPSPETIADLRATAAARSARNGEDN